MPYEMEWLQQNRVIATHLGESITMEEIALSSSEYMQMMDAGIAPVHIITDLTKLKKYPTNLVQARNSALYLSHPSFGWHVIYGTPTIVASLIKVFSSATQTRVASFSTFEQALAFLREKDETVHLDAR